MLDLEALSFLRTPDGIALLLEAESVVREENGVVARVSRLRKRHPPNRVASALELTRLRHRARAKFSRADGMYFTPEGFEQASSEQVANWRAARFPSGGRILDLCCGNGGDLVALSTRGQAIGFDLNPAAAFCARANVEALVPSAKSSESMVACADVTRLCLAGEVAMLDPSRRRNGLRVRVGEEYSPPLNFIDRVRERIPNLCVKVSPALDDETLDNLCNQRNPIGRVEFVSEAGICKEAAVWFGEIGPRSRRSGSVLPSGASLERCDDAGPPSVSTPRGWLYEPDPAIVRAHLIRETAELLGAAQLDSQIAYLTCDEPVETPFATGYRILDWMPFSLKRLDQRLRQMGRAVYAVKRRGVPLDPEAIGRELRRAGEQDAVVVLTRVNGAPAAIICDRADRPVEQRN